MKNVRIPGANLNLQLQNNRAGYLEALLNELAMPGQRLFSNFYDNRLQILRSGVIPE